ncbi:MAG TPA: hypothetical protein VIV84_03120 [Burkholderiaceae bacterium]
MHRLTFSHPRDWFKTARSFAGCERHNEPFTEAAALRLLSAASASFVDAVEDFLAGATEPVIVA